MIDLKDLRDNPDKYRTGALLKKMDASIIDRLLAVDAQIRPLQMEREELTAEQNRIGKEIGPLAGKIKKATGDEKAKLEAEMKKLQERPAAIKQRIAELGEKIAALEPQRDDLLLLVPQPPDPDVPRGNGPEDNVEIRRWNPGWFDTAKSFEQNKGFKPKNHIDLMLKLGMVDFERGVKIAGSRSYVLIGAGMRLHMAVLRYAIDMMINENGFTAMNVPVLVREEAMTGTGFFPHGKEQAYEVGERTRGGTHDMYLTGTGEVGLMGYHMGEMLDFETLPLKYTTVSTCFRREAGAAGKDTKGIYRIHQFDKVEQVVICKADEAESRMWHKTMMGYVETLLQRFEIPYRLLQCCTADLGPKNVDMIDIESWMPSRATTPVDELPDVSNYKLIGQPGDFWCNVRPSRIEEFKARCGDDFFLVVYDDEHYYRVPFSKLKDLFIPDLLQMDEKQAGQRWIVHIHNDELSVVVGDNRRAIRVESFKGNNLMRGGYSETHSASRLYDFQCRRLNIRYKDPATKKNIVCHALNNTVAASPRILIPIVELYQNADGTITVPKALRPYMNGMEKIG